MLRFRNSTEKRKCQDSQWSFSCSAVAKFIGNAVLMAGNADIYKGNSKAAENTCFLNPAELREFTLMESSQGNLSVFITFPLRRRQSNCHITLDSLTSLQNCSPMTSQPDALSHWSWYPTGWRFVTSAKMTKRYTWPQLGVLYLFFSFRFSIEPSVHLAVK